MTDWLKGGGKMAERVRHHPWDETPLGPIEAWPDVLKTTVALCLESHFPQAVIWGESLITLYNDAFTPILGKKPAALGRPFADVWREAWSEIGPIAEAAFAGQATFIEDFPLVVERGGNPEQAYFTFCYSPVRDHRGRVVGMLDTVTETTATVVAGKRLAFLDALGREVAEATDPDLIMAVTTRRVAEHLGLSNCAYADMDADQDGFTIRGDWAAPGSPNILGHYSLADFGQRAVSELSAGRPLIIHDNLAELAAHEAASFQALGIGATICMPLIKDGRLTALMAIHDKVPRQWSDDDLALLSEVTERSWAHIERVRADAAVREAVGALTELNATLEQRVDARTTQLLHAEEALRQSQKLEAIGQLTGGVAHDFNNLLTIIRSSLHFLRQPQLAEERRKRYVDMLTETIERGSKLTGQLLAFARRQALNPEVFDVGQRLQTVVDMLEAAVGACVRVELELPEQSCFVHVDLGQFETALINMAVNARDAMNGEGVLTLRLSSGAQLPAAPGQARQDGLFVALDIIDRGRGLAPELVGRIFEPFFTTKAVGQGTGLGLSQVYGFAKQSGGDVDVRSTPGQGTTFTLFLPQVAAPPAQTVASQTLAPVAAHGERRRVLVVEDNPEVGNIAEQILCDLGYHAVWVTSAEAALELVGAHAQEFDVVFSDVVMPGMGGIALAKELRRRRHSLPVVLTSGFSHALVEEGCQGFELLRKPYSADPLGQALGSALREAGSR